MVCKWKQVISLTLAIKKHFKDYWRIEFKDHHPLERFFSQGVSVHECATVWLAQLACWRTHSPCSDLH